jgi:hypothetical protein
LSEGAEALADEDAKALISGTQARADWRVLGSAALIGWGVGLALGGLYLSAGMARAIADHGRAEQVAQVGEALRGPLSVDPLARAAYAAATSGVAPVPTTAQLAGATRHARELDCLAQAVYFEARGESVRGQAAVATVIMNRVKNPHFPKTVCGVVYQGASHRNGCQFSFACDGSAERVVEWNAWERARGVAAHVLSGAVLRDVGSATHFHTIDVDPDWGSSMLRTARVGLHVFYRLNPHARPPALDNDDDDPPQFAGRPVQPNAQLRVAAALTVPPPATDITAGVSPMAKPAGVLAPAPTIEPRPAPAAEPSERGPISRSDAPRSQTSPS